MASHNTNFIKIPVKEGSFQTMPVEPSKRISDDEIKIELCSADDAYRIVSLFPNLLTYLLTPHPGRRPLRLLP